MLQPSCNLAQSQMLGEEVHIGRRMHPERLHCAGMGVARPAQHRPGLLSSSPQLGGNFLNQQTLASTRLAQQQQALAMAQPSSQMPVSLPRPPGFPGPSLGFPGLLGPGQAPRIGPPRPMVGLPSLPLSEDLVCSISSCSSSACAERACNNGLVSGQATACYA